MNRFLSIAPLLVALLLASGPASAQRLNVNPYSTSAAPRGPADQDLNFGSITNTICFHHVPVGTTEADVSVRCGSNNWPPEPACRDPRLREHGVPTLVGTTYFDRPHQVVVHLAFDTSCSDGIGGGGVGTSSGDCIIVGVSEDGGQGTVDQWTHGDCEEHWETHPDEVDPPEDSGH